MIVSAGVAAAVVIAAAKLATEVIAVSAGVALAVIAAVMIQYPQE